MPSLISMAKTTEAVKERIKTVTRRDGWRGLVGRDDWPILQAVDKSPRSGGPWERIAMIRVVRADRVALGDPEWLTAEDVAREGFPDMSPADFVEFYCSPKSPDPDREVTRIEFEYVGRCAICGRWNAESELFGLLRGGGGRSQIVTALEFELEGARCKYCLEYRGVAATKRGYRRVDGPPCQQMELFG